MYLILHYSNAAIKPPIALSETKYTRKNTYVSTITEGSDIVYNYSVHTGAEFGVECSSITTTEDQLAGVITWYKKTTVSGWCTHLYTLVY